MIALAVLLVVALSSFAAINFMGAVPAQAASDEKADKRTINVSGQSVINIAPNIAYLSLGVLTEDKDAKVAQQNNAKSMDKVISLIKAAGVKAEDIKTVSFNIYPKYDYNKDTGASSIVGYSVSNTVQVTVRDITKVGNLIDIASDSGVNMSNNISFGLSDYEKTYNEALKKAVENGKKRAETMALALGVKLKSAITVTESGGYSPPVFNPGMYDKAVAEGAPSTPILSGTIEVRASVSMVYEY